MKSVLIIFLILNINFSKIFDNFNFNISLSMNGVLGMPINSNRNRINNINDSINAPYHLKNQSQILSTSNYQFSLYQNQLKKNYNQNQNQKQ